MGGTFEVPPSGLIEADCSSNPHLAVQMTSAIGTIGAGKHCRDKRIVKQPKTDFPGV
jgi:hypothetical protein